MTPAPVCVLYTQDADLARRAKAFLRAVTQVRHVNDPDRLDAVLRQVGPTLLILDLRARECRELIEEIQNEWRDFLVIALGTPRSEPMREADQSGIYAAEDLQLERRRFQALVGRALDYLKALQENRDLRETSAMARGSQIAPRLDVPPDAYRQPSLPLLRFPRVLRRFENTDVLLASIVEAVADAAGASRVGIFARARQGNRYRLRASLRCLPETWEIEFGERDALVRWSDRHPHLFSGANLALASDQR